MTLKAKDTSNIDFDQLNDEAVETILSSYDQLAHSVDSYSNLLTKQLGESDPGNVVLESRLRSSLQALMSMQSRLEESSGSFSDPDAGLFDALMELRHGQHHIRLARQGRMV